MPRNTQAPQNADDAKPEDQTPPVTPETTDPLAGLSEEGHEPFVDRLLENAQKLQDEKDTLFGRIDKNRSVLRDIKGTGALSEKQSAAIDLFYPVRQKKNADPATNGAAAA